MKNKLLYAYLIFACVLFVGIKQVDDWKAPASAKTLENPLLRIKNNKKITKFSGVMYRMNCASCHGDTGLGDGIASRFLKKSPTNLTTKKFQSQTDGEIFWKIGSGNSPMPSFKDLLSEKQMWLIVNYLRTWE